MTIKEGARALIAKVAELSGKVVSHAVRWLYSRHEVAVFSAPPSAGDDDSLEDVEVARFQGGAVDVSLPSLRPEVARMLHQRLASRALRGDTFYLLMVAGCGVGFGWVRQSGLIGIEEVSLTLVLQFRQICFFDFFLDPSVRGRGLYTKFLRKLRWLFRTRHVLIYSETWNLASLAGISSAGFEPYASVQGRRLLGMRYPVALSVHPHGTQGPAPVHGVPTANKIKILFAIDHFHGVGGTEKHLAQLVQLLPRDSFECSVVVFDLGSVALIDDMRAAGVAVHHVPVGRIYAPNALRRAVELARIIRRGRFDIVQTFHQTSDTFAALVAKLCGVKHLVSSKRDTGALRRPIHVFLNRRLRRLFDRFIVVSDAVADAVAAANRLDRSRIVKIYNGVDAQSFAPPGTHEVQAARSRLGFATSDFVIGMVAAFRPEKDYGTFLEGAVRAMAAIPSLKILAIGGGPLLEKFRGRYDVDRFRSRIIFTGAVDDVTPYLRAMDVGCLIPARNEGFSNAVLEKMAMGLPLIVTDVGGNAEAVVDGANGIVIPPANVDAFSAALARLHANRPGRLAMGRKSRELVEHRYSLSGMGRTHEMLYRSLVA